MHECQICSPAIWKISNVSKSLRVLTYLRALIPVVEGRDDVVPGMLLADLPRSFEAVCANLFKMIKTDPKSFCTVAKNLVIRELSAEIYYNSASVNVVMFSEVLRLFLVLEPKSTEWRLAYLHKEFDSEFLASIMSVTADSKEFKDVRDFYELYKGIDKIRL